MKKKNLGPKYQYFIITKKVTFLGVCASHLFCPTSEKGGGGQKMVIFRCVCARVPSRFFLSVPANGIKRVGEGAVREGLEGSSTVPDL